MRQITLKKKIFLSIVSVLVFLTLLEIILRLVPLDVDSFTAIIFASDKNSPKLFQNDPILWWKLKPNTNVTFTDVKVSTNSEGFRSDKTSSDGKSVLTKENSTRQIVRILCLGDSSTFGWRLNYRETYPYLLESMLKRNFKSKKFEVINAGVPGYSSLQTLLFLKYFALKYRPNVICVYIGNNECWPAEKSDKERWKEEASALLIRRILDKSKTYKSLKKLILYLRPDLIEGADSSKPTVRVSEDDFKKNLKEMISLAKQYKSKIILLNVPVNLKVRPLRTPHSSIPLEAKKWFGLAKSDLLRGNLKGAIPKLEKAVNIKPDYIDAIWHLGFAYEKIGKRKEAMLKYEAAKELNPFSERIKNQYNKIIEEVAQEKQIPLVDIISVFQRFDEKTLFIDHCHPTPFGQKIIAKEIYKTLISSGIVGTK